MVLVDGLHPMNAGLLMTGGAGFLGSHLCETLLQRGHRVICVDNLVVSTLENIDHLRDDALTFVNHDVIEPMHVDEPVDFVYPLAALASPIDYLRMPLRTYSTERLQRTDSPDALRRNRARAGRERVPVDHAAAVSN